MRMVLSKNFSKVNRDVKMSESNVIDVLLVNGREYSTKDVEKLENKAICLLYENKQYKKAIDNICSLENPVNTGKNTNFESEGSTSVKEVGV